MASNPAPRVPAVANAKAPQARVAADEVKLAREKLLRAQSLLSPYFPAGSWELKNPKVLESDRAKLLIKDYQNMPDGRVKLQPCTVLFFPDQPVATTGTPSAIRSRIP